MTGSNGTGSSQWHTFSLQADYSLSKRTDVYLQGTFYQHASGDLGNFGENVASINSLSPSSNQDQTALAIGLRHHF